MSNTLRLHRACIVIVFFCSLVGAQSTNSTQSPVVPPLVNFNGTLTDVNGKPLTGIVGVTFYLYQEQQGGAPLWIETQNVQPDKNGNYSVMLGSTSATGLPASIFASGEAHWLGVQAQGQPEQPRVMLLSVPYALKAGDAATVGGLPASAFVMANPSTSARPSSGKAKPATETQDYIPMFIDGSGDLGNSILYESGGTEVGIGTTTPAATLEVNGTAKFDGLASFATGQTFPGTVTGITAGTGLIETGPTGSPTLSINIPFANQNYAQLGAANTFKQSQTVDGSTNMVGDTRVDFNGLNKGSYTPAIRFGAGNTGEAIASDRTGTVNVNGIDLYTDFTPRLSITNSGSVGIGNAAPTQTFEVDSGNALVRGTQNFHSAGSTAFLYVGDTHHPIEAAFETGLSLGAYDAPQALFIADFTGNVGIGTTSPTSGILTTVANTASVVGVSATGYNAPANSNANGYDGIHTTGGYGDPANLATGGVGLVATGGNAGLLGPGNTGIIGTGGTGGGETPDSGGPGGIGASFFGGQGGFGGFGAGGDGVTGNGTSTINFPGDGSGGVFTGGGSGGPSGYDGLGDGVDGIAGSGYAGDFTGDVNTTGSYLVNGSAMLKIDHPLDPANKYLLHALVESSEMMNIYTGNVTTDAQGEATVRLPEWFEVLNTDFRYQLTVIGQFAQAIVAREIQNRQFLIKTNAPNVKVSWQITGVRQDAYAKAHPLVVEQEKEARLRGFYTHPELYGAPPEKQIEWARHPQTMRRMREWQARPQPAMRAAVRPAGSEHK